MEKAFNYTMTDDELFENILKDENLMLNHVVIPAGSVFPKHPTDADVYAIIIRGQLNLVTGDGEEKVYEKGQVVNIPKGILSELGNKSETVTELFVVKCNFDEA